MFAIHIYYEVWDTISANRNTRAAEIANIAISGSLKMPILAKILKKKLGRWKCQYSAGRIAENANIKKK